MRIHAQKKTLTLLQMEYKVDEVSHQIVREFDRNKAIRLPVRSLTKKMFCREREHHQSPIERHICPILNESL